MALLLKKKGQGSKPALTSWPSKVKMAFKNLSLFVKTQKWKKYDKTFIVKVQSFKTFLQCNIIAHVRRLCGKTAVLSNHRCLINTGVEKNENLLDRYKLLVEHKWL
jgi:hypothetical protein